MGGPAEREGGVHLLFAFVLAVLCSLFYGSVAHAQGTGVVYFALEGVGGYGPLASDDGVYGGGAVAVLVGSRNTPARVGFRFEGTYQDFPGEPKRFAHHTFIGDLEFAFPLSGGRVVPELLLGGGLLQWERTWIGDPFFMIVVSPAQIESGATFRVGLALKFYAADHWYLGFQSSLFRSFGDVDGTLARAGVMLGLEY